jgi:hypothetical protein
MIPRARALPRECLVQGLLRITHASWFMDDDIEVYKRTANGDSFGMDVTLSYNRGRYIYMGEVSFKWPLCSFQ